jgi:acyl carrier protein
MKPSASTRYAREQTLCGLQDVFFEDQGCRSPIEADMPVDEYLKQEDRWDSLDFLDIIFRIEWRFGLNCSMEEWQRLFFGPGREERWRREKKPWPWVTFGELADFIADRAEPISFGPVTFFGRPCQAAGAFLGVEQVARQISPKVEQFGPSTPIRARFRGYRLYRLWERLRWISAGGLPQLPQRSHSAVVTLSTLGLLALVAGLIAAFITRNVAYPVPGSLLLGIAIALAFVLDYLADPLPADVRTFGDLARRLAETE